MMELSVEDMGNLLDQAMAGSETAATQLTEYCGPYLRMVVRRWLHKRLRSQYDSVDFVQDVWASFFAHGYSKETFENPKQLIAFLQQMARNKVITAFRRGLVSQKANVKRELPLEEAPIPRDRQAALISSQPTPSQIMIREERWQNLLRKLRPLYREIVGRYLEGMSQVAIANELNINERTVARGLERALAVLDADS